MARATSNSTNGKEATTPSPGQNLEGRLFPNACCLLPHFTNAEPRLSAPRRQRAGRKSETPFIRIDVVLGFRAEFHPVGELFELRLPVLLLNTPAVHLFARRRAKTTNRKPSVGEDVEAEVDGKDG